MSGWIYLAEYGTMTESSGTFTEVFMITIQGSAWMEKHLMPSEYFVLNSKSDFIHISSTGSLTDGNMELGSESQIT